MYPRKLDNENKFSPNLVMAWAQMTKLNIEIVNKKNKLAEYSSEENNDTIR